MATQTERFEIINDLYYRRYSCLRPGKSESPETGRDANSDENKTRFDQWFATQAFTEAIDRIATLNLEIEEAQASWNENL